MLYDKKKVVSNYRDGFLFTSQLHIKVEEKKKLK